MRYIVIYNQQESFEMDQHLLYHGAGTSMNV
jgi:hypothetical protein